MEKEKLCKGLIEFIAKLYRVKSAFEKGDASFGNERFMSWVKNLRGFLQVNLPQEVASFEKRIDSGEVPLSVLKIGSEFRVFMLKNGKVMHAYLESLIHDIRNDEYVFETPVEELSEVEHGEVETVEVDRTKVFIVHGHHEATKQKVARFIESLDLEAIILHEQPNSGQTIIEKIEKYSHNIGFAVVLYTPDDMGKVKTAEALRPRARQNVVFEHGYVVAKMGRENVAFLVAGDAGDFELPNDISGVVYMSGDDWKLQLAQELNAAEYDIDFNKAFKK